MHPNIGLVLGFCLLSSLQALPSCQRHCPAKTYFDSICWRDPSSKFFRAKPAHVPLHSAVRVQQAIQYADSIEPRVKKLDNPPELCIGIPSVRRQGISYLKSTLGSLQHGLTDKERASLRFVVFIGHTDQSEHPDFGQSWLENMADELPEYSSDDFSLAQDMETKKIHAVKAKFDYTVAMKTCYNTGAPYILMLEDDVVFRDGWHSRTMEALEEAKSKTAIREGSHKSFLYLRLFYYEGLLGWNSESWARYLTWSLATVTGVLGSLLLLRHVFPSLRLYLTRSGVVLVTFVFAPLLILWYFASGANCMLPQAEGVHLMSKYACCGQGLVFPRDTVGEKMLPAFRLHRWSEVPTDSFIEWYADKTGDLRWALTPVVMQHVGGKSSHGAVRDEYGTMTPTHIWNIGFEQSDWGT